MQGICPAFLLPNAVAILSCSYDSGICQNMIFSLFGATAPGGFPTRCCFLQPAFPDDLVTLVLLNPVFCVLSAGRPGCLCRFRNHGTKEFRAGNSQQ